jgi:hypothetical protein
MEDAKEEIVRMFFHRDDAVAHRLRLSGDRLVAKKATAWYLGVRL